MRVHTHAYTNCTCVADGGGGLFVWYVHGMIPWETWIVQATGCFCPVMLLSEVADGRVGKEERQEG